MSHVGGGALQKRRFPNNKQLERDVQSRRAQASHQQRQVSARIRGRRQGVRRRFQNWRCHYEQNHQVVCALSQFGLYSRKSPRSQTRHRKAKCQYRILYSIIFHILYLFSKKKKKKKKIYYINIIFNILYLFIKKK